jgi:uncharacterized membrane protein (DUF485 family)
MEASPKSVRTGLIFFFLYLFLYMAFVGISAFEPAVLEQRIAGVNWAIVSGIGLILGAIVLAILYCWICRDIAE